MCQMMPFTKQHSAYMHGLSHVSPSQSILLFTTYPSIAHKKSTNHSPTIFTTTILRAAWKTSFSLSGQPSFSFFFRVCVCVCVCEFFWDQYGHDISDGQSVNLYMNEPPQNAACANRNQPTTLIRFQSICPHGGYFWHRVSTNARSTRPWQFVSSTWTSSMLWLPSSRTWSSSSSSSSSSSPSSS